MPGQLPPRTPSRSRMPRPRTYPRSRRSVARVQGSASSAASSVPPPSAAPTQVQDGDRRGRRQRIARSLSLGAIDTSHIEGTELGRRYEGARGGHPDAIETTVDSSDGPPGSPEKAVGTENTYSAEEIALRRFMTSVAWGPGMPVLKHNRGRGRARRLLKFNEEDGILSWGRTLPPFCKTRVPTGNMQRASRVGHLVTLKIANQGDVGFQCIRLTDAIVLDVGLNGVITGCSDT